MIESVVMFASISALYFIFYINGRRSGYSEGWDAGYEDGKKYLYELLNVLDDRRLVYFVRHRGIITPGEWERERQRKEGDGNGLDKKTD